MTMRVVAVSAGLSMVAAVASSALFTRTMQDDIDEARRIAVVAQVTAESIERQLESAKSDLAIYAKQSVDAMASDGAAQKRLDGIRAELDEMQTQIRILRLKP